LTAEKRVYITRPMAYNIFMTPAQLIAWRKRAGCSQARLAEVLAVDVMTVSRWERGIRGIPPFLHLALRCVETQGGETDKKSNKMKLKRRRK
jgi:DNA-binding transcriptional regulator YiaG